MFDVTHGIHAVFMLKGRGSPSSWAKTQVSPQATAPLRLRRVLHEGGGAVAQAVFQECWSRRDVDAMFVCEVSVSELIEELRVGV